MSKIKALVVALRQRIILIVAGKDIGVVVNMCVSAVPLVMQTKNGCDTYAVPILTPIDESKAMCCRNAFPNAVKYENPNENPWPQWALEYREEL